MIALPDLDSYFAAAFGHENAFYHTCDKSRIGKLLSHFELYKLGRQVPGAIVECGVFRGASLLRFAAFRDLLGDTDRKLIGFDSFGAFPKTDFVPDQGLRERFVNVAGSESIGQGQLESLFQRKEARNVELVAGDITQTLPHYVEKHPNLTIAVLNLDVDIYEPSVTVLKYLYPRIVPGGVLILDDYGTFPGETQAVDEYFASLPGPKPEILDCATSRTPKYVIKPRSEK